MKRNYVSVLVIVAMLCGSFILNAQQKNYINYQGVVRDADNELLVEETVEIGIALKFGATNAPIQYEESHIISTDMNGVFSLQIGSGINSNGDYENLPWGEASFVAVSFNGSELGTTELMAVPYAITSGSDQWIVNGNAIANKNIGEVRISDDLQVFGEFVLNDGNAVSEISDDGTLPIAYGLIKDNADIDSGSGNFTIEKIAIGIYNITIPNEDEPENWTVLTTINHSAPGIASVAYYTAGRREFNINTWSLDATRSDFSFSFVVYKQ